MKSTLMSCPCLVCMSSAYVCSLFIVVRDKNTKHVYNKLIISKYVSLNAQYAAISRKHERLIWSHIHRYMYVASSTIIQDVGVVF